MAGSCSFDAFLSKRWWRMRRIGLFHLADFLGGRFKSWEVDRPEKFARRLYSSHVFHSFTFNFLISTNLSQRSTKPEYKHDKNKI